MEAATIDPTTFDLSVKNPNGGEEVTHRSPEEIMDEITALDAESAEVLQTIRGLNMKNGWELEETKWTYVTSKVGSSPRPIKNNFTTDTDG